MKKILISFVTSTCLLCSAALCIAEDFPPESIQNDTCAVSMLIQPVCANTHEAARETARQEIAPEGPEAGTPRIEISETFFDCGDLKDGCDLSSRIYGQEFRYWGVGNRKTYFPAEAVRWPVLIGPLLRSRGENSNQALPESMSKWCEEDSNRHLK